MAFTVSSTAMPTPKFWYRMLQLEWDSHRRVIAGAWKTGMGLACRTNWSVVLSQFTSSCQQNSLHTWSISYSRHPKTGIKMTVPHIGLCSSPNQFFLCKSLGLRWDRYSSFALRGYCEYWLFPDIFYHLLALISISGYRLLRENLRFNHVLPLPKTSKRVSSTPPRFCSRHTSSVSSIAISTHQVLTPSVRVS